MRLPYGLRNFYLNLVILILRVHSLQNNFEKLVCLPYRSDLPPLPHLLALLSLWHSTGKTRNSESQNEQFHQINPRKIWALLIGLFEPLPFLKFNSSPKGIM